MRCWGHTLQARVLPTCGHSFCEACLRKPELSAAAAAALQVESGKSSRHGVAIGRTHLQCPSCVQEQREAWITEHPSQAAVLRRNIFIAKGTASVTGRLAAVPSLGAHRWLTPHHCCCWCWCLWLCATAKGEPAPEEPWLKLVPRSRIRTSTPNRAADDIVAKIQWWEVCAGTGTPSELQQTVSPSCGVCGCVRCPLAM